MKKVIVLLLVLQVCFGANIFAQAYDIVIKGGHVIDPKNNLDAVMDIAVKNNCWVNPVPSITPNGGRISLRSNPSRSTSTSS